MLIALVVYFGQGILSTDSSLESNTQSIMDSSMVSANATSGMTDMGAANVLPDASITPENDSSVIPASTDEPAAPADNAPAKSMPAGGKPPAGWKPKDGSSPPSGAAPGGTEQTTASVTPSVMPGGSAGTGNGTTHSGASPSATPTAGTSIFGTSTGMPTAQGMMPSLGSGTGSTGTHSTSTSQPSSSQSTTGLKTSIFGSMSGPTVPAISSLFNN